MASKKTSRPTVKALTEHLVCRLCNGYLVDATTIVECLHSFCRSCIVQYLQSSSFCPTCEAQLHKGSPLRSLKPDKTLQDIVYKMVPNLFHNEMRRRRSYYDSHPQYVDQTTPEQRGDCLERFYSPNDSISLSLEYADRGGTNVVSNKNGLNIKKEKVIPPKRYLKCPSLFTVGLLKKFIRLKFDLPTDYGVDIFQRRESLADEYTLLDIAYIYPWKRSAPMRFFYRIRDPKMPEHAEELDADMPSLTAAMIPKAARVTRRTSSTYSHISSADSPRASPTMGGKRIKLECPSPEPEPAKLTALPPTAFRPIAAKPPDFHIKSSPSVTKDLNSPKRSALPSQKSPKIMLTISPSKGTVKSSTTDLTSASGHSPQTPLPMSDVKNKTKPEVDSTVVDRPKSTQTTHLIKPTVAVTNSNNKNTQSPLLLSPARKVAIPNLKPSTATVTTRTANGSFITTKDPTRATNGMSLASKHNSIASKSVMNSPKNVPSSSINTLIQAAEKVDKSSSMTSNVDNTSKNKNAATIPLKILNNPDISLLTSKASLQLANGKPIGQTVSNGFSGEDKNIKIKSVDASKVDEQKVETAKAILQLSMSFSPAQDSPKSCGKHPNSWLSNKIDEIVKDLGKDDEDTTSIKSEPKSPLFSPQPSPNSPRQLTVKNDQDATQNNQIPRIAGLTITPIERSHDQSQKPSYDRMSPLTGMKRPLNTNISSWTKEPVIKVAKIDVIADGIKMKKGEKQKHLIDNGCKIALPSFNNVKKQQVQNKNSLPKREQQNLPQKSSLITPSQKSVPKHQELENQLPKNTPKFQYILPHPAKPPSAMKLEKSSQQHSAPEKSEPQKIQHSSSEVQKHQRHGSPQPKENPGNHKSESVSQLQGQKDSQDSQQCVQTLKQHKTAPSTQNLGASPKVARSEEVSSDSAFKNRKPMPELQRLQRPTNVTATGGTTVNGSFSLAEVKEQLAKKGQYSPPPAQRTPPKLIEIAAQRKSSVGLHRDGFGALDLSSASPRTEHGGCWTPPPNFLHAQRIPGKRQLVPLIPKSNGPRPSSLSSSSPSPPADNSSASRSPDLPLDPLLLPQQFPLQSILLKGCNRGLMDWLSAGTGLKRK